MKSSAVALGIVLAVCGLARADEPAEKHAGKGQNEASPSQPAEKEGLAVVVVPAKRVFVAWEPLSFSVTYRNVSKKAFRLPDQPGLYNYWQMDPPRRKPTRPIRGEARCQGAWRCRRRPTAAIEPGKTLSVEVKLTPYMYAAGTRWTRTGAAEELPVGKYQVSFDIHFLTKQFIMIPGRHGPGQPAMQPLTDNDPVPIWPSDSITTSPVEIEIRDRFEKDGLSVDIVPTEQVFKAGEPLTFSVIYRNVGKQAFRLPDEPGLNGNWRLNFTRGNTPAS